MRQREKKIPKIALLHYPGGVLGIVVIPKDPTRFHLQISF